MKKIIKKWLGIDVLEESITSVNVSYGIILEYLEDIKETNDSLEEEVNSFIGFLNHRNSSVVDAFSGSKAVAKVPAKKAIKKAIKKVAKNKK